MPFYHGLNAKYIENFRMRAYKFILESPDGSVPTAEEAHNMTSPSSAADELVISDSDFVTMYNVLRPFLTSMLDTHCEAEWDVSFHQALPHIVHDPEKSQVLHNIHQNPGYYSLWYLDTIEGNLKSKGSTPAEANHSSIVKRKHDVTTKAN